MTAETVAGLIVAMFSALVATAITGFLWLIKLGNRVSLLESGYSMLEKALEADQETLAMGLREIRAEIQGVKAELKATREEMLRWFTPSEDFRRLEDKVD